MITRTDDHWYDTPIGRLPGATKVLDCVDKPALVQWAANTAIEFCKMNPALLQEEVYCPSGDIWKLAKAEHKRLKEEAGDIGSAVHAIIQRILEGVPPTQTELEQYEKPLAAFYEWYQAHDVSVMQLEAMVYSKHGYAGTVDLICFLDDKLTLIDFKTGSGIYREAYLQVAAYEKAANEMDVLRIQQRGILHLDKKTGVPTYHEISRKESRHALKSFLYLLKYWKNEREKMK